MDCDHPQMEYIGKIWRDSPEGSEWNKIGTSLFACEKCGSVWISVKSSTTIKSCPTTLETQEIIARHHADALKRKKRK